MAWTIDQWLFLEKATKYCTDFGILLTTGLSIYSLRSETVVKSNNSLIPNKFTSAGRRYLIVLTVSTILTFTAAVVKDLAETRLKDLADATFQQRLQNELEREFGVMLKSFDQGLVAEQGQVVDSLNSSLEKEHDKLNGNINRTATKMKSLQGDLSKSIKESSDRLNSMQTLMEVTGRDLSLANRRVRSTLVRLSAKGGASYDYPWYYNEEAVNATCPGIGQYGTKQDYADHQYPCVPIRNLRNASAFFSALDPKGQFETSVTVTLSSFTLSFSLADCDGIARCILDDIRHQDSYQDGSSFQKNFPLENEPWEDHMLEAQIPIKPDHEGAFLSRDTDLQRVSIQLCDPSSQFWNRLSGVTPGYDLEVRIDESGENGSNFAKVYRLRPHNTFNRQAQVAEGQGPPCTIFEYRPW